MGKRSRFWFGFLLSFWLVLPMAVIVRAAEGCHPSTCHSFDTSDWRDLFLYYWFECDTDHCKECGWGDAVD